MFLLKTISPNTIPNRKADWDYKLCIYHWLLLRLATLYKRSAISDTIILEGIQIIHSVRDHWFEQELQRFRIDTALHMEYQHFPHIIKHRYRRSHIFNWTETLEISYNNKKHRINRADYINFETQFKTSYYALCLYRREDKNQYPQSHPQQNKRVNLKLLSKMSY